ncbi:AIPR family protein [Rhodanobacter ginsengisoli]|uniref:AIPR family protein n=1 Tax=Rhodanobacter ginsengisoli TaxID=418646 RepID=A0ABW0QRA2_9GAMM
MKYETLVHILDAICQEAPEGSKRYKPDENDVEKMNQARARAFIHLYLKVKFGLSDFSDRERTITDASEDGGIDAYHIDSETKVVYLIQSKFRTNEKNFEDKEISLNELLAMEIDRIMRGEETGENGVPYNGKIKQLQRDISSIDDIARYNYKIVILANLESVPPNKIRQLCGGYSAEVFNYQKAYQALVLPVLTGTYFTANDIMIPVDLSSKNAGSKISYNVKTKNCDCEITVLFVPVIEIAKIMDKYRNAILKYNPRSYLDLEGKSVNSSIKSTLLERDTNEFALFNNGITMLSDETYINERIGQKNKAQLQVKNPQIINGGQTSFTLSRIYHADKVAAEKDLANKEVLLKVITLLGNDSQENKLQLIDEISNATNKQTPVINADRFSNESFHITIQQMVFENFGLLYERKRGEFSDGIRDGYLSESEVVERNHFWRLYYTANGRIARGFQKRLFQQNEFSGIDPNDKNSFKNLYMAIQVFGAIKGRYRRDQKIPREEYAKVYLYVRIHGEESALDAESIEANMRVVNTAFKLFFSWIESQEGNIAGRRTSVNRKTGEKRVTFSQERYFKGPTFEKDFTEWLTANRALLDSSAREVA